MASNPLGIKLPELSFDAAGLIPAIIQHADTNEVLMLGYMNQQAVNQTLATGRVTFWSRSRNRIWVKGETSGNHLSVVSVSTDCDYDALLITATPNGPTCHTGSSSCFEADDVDS